MKRSPQRSLNNRLKCRKPVFMRVSGICFIKWLWFGSICGESNGVISFEKVNKKRKKVQAMLPTREEALKLIRDGLLFNPGPWGKHCLTAAHCAEKSSKCMW